KQALHLRLPPAADLKFPPHLSERQIEKRHYNHRVASALGLPKSASRCRNRDEVREPGTGCLAFKTFARFRFHHFRNLPVLRTTRAPSDRGYHFVVPLCAGGCVLTRSTILDRRHR